MFHRVFHTVVFHFIWCILCFLCVLILRGLVRSCCSTFLSPARGWNHSQDLGWDDFCCLFFLSVLIQRSHGVSWAFQLEKWCQWWVYWIIPSGNGWRNGPSRPGDERVEGHELQTLQHLESECIWMSSRPDKPQTSVGGVPFRSQIMEEYPPNRPWFIAPGWHDLMEVLRWSSELTTNCGSWKSLRRLLQTWVEIPPNSKYCTISIYHSFNYDIYIYIL